MNKDQTLNVLYLTDNNYAVFAGVSITSLFINNRGIGHIHVFVIDDSISQENKDKLLDLAGSYDRELTFLDMTEGIRTLERMGIPKYRNSYTTYLKLFAFGLLPDTVHRIFFIDSDTVVVGSLEEMIDIDMEGCVVGAVRDGISAPYKIALGFPSGDSWFNMGVMLVDVDKWKETDSEGKIIRQLEKRTGYIAVDQDLLNITQHGNIMTLHPRYNATPHHYIYKHEDFLRAFPQEGFYDVETLREAEETAVIRHFERFVGESAWSEGTAHPYAKLFDKYLALSPWSDYQKQPSKLKPVLRIENMLYRVLPHKVFVYVYAWAFKRYLLKTNKHLTETEGIKNIS